MNRIARRLLTVAVLVLLAVPLAWTAWNLQAGARLRRTLDSMKTRGWPMTFDDLRSPAVPDAENAAPLLNRAFLQMAGGNTAFSPAVAPFRDLAEIWTGETNLLARLRADPALASNVCARVATPEVGEVIGLLREAAARPACNFNLKYENGVALLLPHVAPTRAAVRLLCLKAWILVRNGDTRGALDCLRDGLTLSRMIADDRVLISLLVSMAGTQTVIDALPHILADAPSGTLTPSLLQGFDADLIRQRQALRPALVAALDGERIAFGGWAFEGILNGTLKASDLATDLGGDNAPRRGAIWAYINPFRPLFKNDYAFYLSFLAGMREAAAGPLDADAIERIRTRSESIPRWAILSRLTVPALDRVLVKIGEQECAIDLARIGLALEVRRMTTGNYPAALDGVSVPGGLPLDGFTRKPFVYHRTADGFRIYGLGENGKDDGGAPRSGGSRDFDIVWEMRR